MESSGGGLIEQLGINWKLLLSQAVNFFILLFILRRFAYKPLLNVIKKRNEKIKEGLEKSKEADIRLQEINQIALKHLEKAKEESIGIIKQTKEKAKTLEQSLKIRAEKEQEKLMLQAKESYQKQREEYQKLIVNQAVDIVKKIIVKTVDLKPTAIDEFLIKKAAAQIEKNEQ